jgi:hypothetical protein
VVASLYRFLHNSAVRRPAVRLRLGKVSDFHATKKEERTVPMLAVVCRAGTYLKKHATGEVLAGALAGIGLPVVVF